MAAGERPRVQRTDEDALRPLARTGRATRTRRAATRRSVRLTTYPDPENALRRGTRDPCLSRRAKDPRPQLSARVGMARTSRSRRAARRTALGSCDAADRRGRVSPAPALPPGDPARRSTSARGARRAVEQSGHLRDALAARAGITRGDLDPRTRSPVHARARAIRGSATAGAAQQRGMADAGRRESVAHLRRVWPRTGPVAPGGGDHRARPGGDARTGSRPARVERARRRARAPCARDGCAAWTPRSPRLNRGRLACRAPDRTAPGTRGLRRTRTATRRQSNLRRPHTAPGLLATLQPPAARGVQGNLCVLVPADTEGRRGQHGRASRSEVQAAGARLRVGQLSACVWADELAQARLRRRARPVRDRRGLVRARACVLPAEARSAPDQREHDRGD